MISQATVWTHKIHTVSFYVYPKKGKDIPIGAYVAVKLDFKEDEKWAADLLADFINKPPAGETKGT
jgi:hypothetical protein